MADKYPRQSFLNKVLDQSGAKHGARQVLQCMCHNSAFDKPEVTITRPQIQAQTRLSRNTVLAAYKQLKAEGSIKAVRNAVGGNGRATTYALRAIGQGADAAPQPQEGRADAPPIWDQVLAKYSLTDPAGFENWVKGCKFEELAGGVLVMSAPSKFKAAHIETHLADRLAQVANSVSPDIERVKVKA